MQANKSGIGLGFVLWFGFCAVIGVVVLTFIVYVVLRLLSILERAT
jgi:hypothetical protein